MSVDPDEPAKLAPAAADAYVEERDPARDRGYACLHSALCVVIQWMYRQCDVWLGTTLDRLICHMFCNQSSHVRHTVVIMEQQALL